MIELVTRLDLRQIVMVDAKGKVGDALKAAENLVKQLTDQRYLKKRDYDVWAEYSGTGPPTPLDR